MSRLLRLFFLFACLRATAFAQPAPCATPSATPAESCGGACITCFISGIGGSTAGFGADGASGFCGSIENDQWFAFIASSSFSTFTLTYSNCANNKGIEMGIYSDCSSPIDCSFNTGASGIVQLVNVPLSIGEVYYLVIDGKDGDICNFSVSVTPSPDPPFLGPTGPIEGPSKSCPGVTANYTVTAAAGAEYYNWTIPLDATLNGISGPGPIKLSRTQGTSVSVKFGAAGGNVSVYPSNACRNGTTKTKSVAVAALPPTILNATVCASDFPYQLPWGDVARGPGLYSTTYASVVGCDSVFILNLKQTPVVTLALGAFFVCEGESISICNQSFSDPGSYSVSCRTGACDTTFVFSVARPPAVILGGGSLNCFNNAVLLGSGNAVGTKVWRNEAGQVIANTDTVTVTQAGKYTLEVTQTVNGKTCISKETIAIKAVDTLRLTALPGISAITCAKPTTTLKFTTNMTASVSGQGVTTTKPALAHELLVTTGGLQTFTATTTGGCTASFTANIPADVMKPAVTTMGDVLSCTKQIGKVRAVTNIPNAIFFWTGPAGSSGSNTGELTVTLPGTYTVLVANPVNSCANTATAVVADLNAPSIHAKGGTIFCPQTNLKLSLTLSGNTTNSTLVWTGPSGFTSTVAEPVVSIPGTYKVVVTNPASGCSSSASVNVTLNSASFALPAAIGGTLTCAATAVTLQVPGALAGYTYQWTGPNGFSSNLPTPSVTTAGTYTVSVTDATNGCKGTTTAVVTANINPPTAQATGGNLPCKPAAVALNCTTNAALATFQWSGPGGFSSSLQNPVANQAGTYRVTVTNSDGCTKTATAGVNQYPGAPYVGINLVTTGGQRRLNCTTTAFSPSYAWTGPNGFTANIRNPIVTDPGIYTVLVTEGTGAGCQAYRSYTVPALRIAEGSEAAVALESGRWQVFPNPATTTVRLRFEGKQVPVETDIFLLDATGRLVLEHKGDREGDVLLDLSAVPAGVYQLLFASGAESAVEPLVVQKL